MRKCYCYREETPTRLFKESQEMEELKMDTGQKISLICSNMNKILLEKNKRYGDSALHPVNVFSKLSATNSIQVRLDDKLNRIKNGPEIPRINDVCDIIGYCVLLLASMDIKETDILKLID